ncbi:hypothetical protein GWK91_00350 [Virgibacillus sp. MSP4-1]|uniref:hypothetical protein n=1 Tax=Virgibacillus sp. MSP4-1 TaxID=2700081 RepID=UPI0005C6F1AE|nr:hypothetical protein [Virgibacillus sp. MSP4-1]QHS21500.1 hypothetical protein GWK91_00350 [Virgibacillus sp. MSP4-1]
MGVGYGIVCKSCSFSKEFMLGVGGDEYYAGENQFDILHPKTKVQVKKAIGDLPIHHVEFDRRLLQCQQCHHLYVRPLMKICYGHQQVFNTNQHCSRCKGKAEIVDNLEFSELACPECNKKSLEMETFTIWD